MSRNQSPHPIHKLVELSYDVLAVIFEYSLPDFDPDRGFPPCTSEAPMNIRGTCQLWKNTALSTPSLWTRLCVVFEPPSPHFEAQGKRFERVTRTMLETWIRRSGVLPLLVFIKCFRYRGRPETAFGVFDPLYAVIPILLKCKNRWRSLFIRASENESNLVRTLLTRERAGAATQLKTIEIMDLSAYPRPMQLPVDLVTRLPVIEFISFNGRALHTDGPLPTLKTLHARIEVANISAMLLHIPQLETLLVTCSDCWSQPRPASIELPNLKRLVFAYHHNEPISEYRENPFVTNLIMRSMTELSVDITGKGKCLSYLLRDVSKLIAVSLPALIYWKTEFRSEYNWFPGPITSEELPILFDIFRRTPSLRVIQLPRAMMDKVAIDKLVLTQEDEPLLPSLNELNVDARLFHPVVAGKENGEEWLKSLRTFSRSRKGEIQKNQKCFCVSFP